MSNYHPAQLASDVHTQGFTQCRPECGHAHGWNAQNGAESPSDPLMPYENQTGYPSEVERKSASNSLDASTYNIFQEFPFESAEQNEEASQTPSAYDLKELPRLSQEFFSTQESSSPSNWHSMSPTTEVHDLIGGWDVSGYHPHTPYDTPVTYPSQTSSKSEHLVSTLGLTGSERGAVFSDDHPCDTQINIPETHWLMLRAFQKDPFNTIDDSQWSTARDILRHQKHLRVDPTDLQPHDSVHALLSVWKELDHRNWRSIRPTHGSEKVYTVIMRHLTESIAPVGVQLNLTGSKPAVSFLDRRDLPG